MNWKIIYFNDQVLEQVCLLPLSIRACFARITERMLVYGPNLGMPYTKALGNGLFEIRAKGKEGIGRVFFFPGKKKTIWILHSYLKKTKRVPKNEMDLARKRMKEVEKNESP